MFNDNGLTVLLLRDKNFSGDYDNIVITLASQGKIVMCPDNLIRHLVGNGNQLICGVEDSIKSLKRTAYLADAVIVCSSDEVLTGNVGHIARWAQVINRFCYRVDAAGRWIPNPPYEDSLDLFKEAGFGLEDVLRVYANILVESAPDELPDGPVSEVFGTALFKGNEAEIAIEDVTYTLAKSNDESTVWVYNSEGRTLAGINRPSMEFTWLNN